LTASTCGNSCTFAEARRQTWLRLCMPRLKSLRDLRGRFRIKNVRFFEPAAARHVYAVGDVLQVFGAVSVGIDHELDAERLGALAVNPIEVEAHGMRVYLDHRAMLGGGPEDGFEIDLVAVALEKQPSRGMAEHGDAGVAYRLDDAGCHVFSA